MMNDYLASLKWFLGTSGGITHRPPTVSTRVIFQARPRWTRNSLPVYLGMNPICQETKGYLSYTNSLGGQSQAWLVRMGRVAEPKTLSRIEYPDAQMSWFTLWQGIRGLSPQSSASMRPRAWLLFQRSLPDTINREKDLPIDWPTMSEFKYLWGFDTPIPQV